MEMLSPLRYWTQWMSKGHAVTLHHMIIVNNVVSILWMASCELNLSRIPNETKTYTLLWRFHDRSGPKILPKWLQQMVCFSFQRTFLILTIGCDHLGSGTREWILIVRTRLPLLTNTRMCFWRIWRMITVPNINVCLSLNPKVYWATISAPPQWLLYRVNLCMIHINCPAMMKNT